MEVRQLLITLDETGKINVAGPIDDPILAYGLLECARDAIRDFNDQQQRRIVPGTPEALALVTP
jgi:hypothetical protein